ncbi:la-related protein 1C [Brassica rapa]|uniref:HTH La-type RNA-binding domain-containing protein n=1 Tax=Brassica campestris TaxID=3711 RepID=M4D590_BRACM|nr:la-related protein 1C [Brassica rapa]
MASAASSDSTSSSTSENRQSRRPSPWSQIVRGESDPPTISSSAAAPSSPQHKAPIDPVPSASTAPLAPVAGDVRSEESGAQGNAGKKPVWKRPSNGASSEVGGPVMGASSWPALSETTKAPSSKSSSDSLKSLGDVASSSSVVVVTVSQGNSNASAPAPKQGGRANPNPTPYNSRQRSFKRNNSASGSTANGTVSQGPVVETPSHNPSPRGQNQRNGSASQPHGGGSDNFSPRDSHRNQNGNHHHHHQGHGGRRNQEHGNQNWNFSRSFNGRDGNAHSQRGAPAFVRHQPPTMQSIPPQFMAAQPIQPFGGPVPFPPELASPYYPRMPFIGPLSPGPVYYQVQDPPLNVKLQKQIQYYFSEENLIRDTYLRGLMDDQGFVPLHVIAGFKKVAELTDSIQQIVEALQGSPFVEVQGDRIRKRYNWQHWLLPEDASLQFVNAVASGVRNLSIGQSSADPIGGPSSQLQPAGAENKAASDGQQQFSVVNPVNNLNGSNGANR